jgi:hypothetical protein
MDSSGVYSRRLKKTTKSLSVVFIHYIRDLRFYNPGIQVVVVKLRVDKNGINLWAYLSTFSFVGIILVNIRAKRFLLEFRTSLLQIPKNI